MHACVQAFFISCIGEGPCLLSVRPSMRMHMQLSAYAPHSAMGAPNDDRPTSICTYLPDFHWVDSRWVRVDEEGHQQHRAPPAGPRRVAGLSLHLRRLQRCRHNRVVMPSRPGRAKRCIWIGQIIDVDLEFELRLAARDATDRRSDTSRHLRALASSLNPMP